MSYIDEFNRLIGREGGYVNHPLDRGGETNYGISQRSYPDLNIASLTRDDAMDIYKRDYWDAINAGGMSPESASIAFDSAVNHGVGYTNQMLQETGGDPQAMLDARRQKYASIIANDPSQAVFEKGWNNRLDDLSPGGKAREEARMAATMQQVSPQVNAQQMYAEADPVGTALTGLASAPILPYSGGRDWGRGIAMASAAARRDNSMLEMQRMRDGIGGNVWSSAGDGILFNKQTGEYKYPESSGVPAGADYWSQNPETGEYAWQSGKMQTGVPAGYKDRSSYNSSANTLRDDFSKETEPLRDMRDKYNQVTNIRSRYDGVENWKSSDDQALIFALSKTLDPGGRVTDSDAKMAGEGGSKWAYAKALYEKYVTGTGSLPPEVRSDILGTINGLYEERMSDYKQTESSYMGRAQRAGVHPRDVFEEFEWKEPMMLDDRETTPDDFSDTDIELELKRRGL